MNETHLAQNIFSFFEKNDRLKEIPDFLMYSRKHLASFEPAVSVWVSDEVFKDDDKKKFIYNEIKELIGTENINFKKKGDLLDDGLKISVEPRPEFSKYETTIEKKAISFLDFLTNEGFYNRIDLILTKLQEIYTKYVEEIVINIKTDTPYTEKFEEIISSFCLSQSGAKRAIVNQTVDTNQGGGFQIRWRDFVYDGTYRSFLSKFK